MKTYAHITVSKAVIDTIRVDNAGTVSKTFYDPAVGISYI
jgi:hypothetical protein